MIFIVLTLIRLPISLIFVGLKIYSNYDLVVIIKIVICQKGHTVINTTSMHFHDFQNYIQHHKNSISFGMNCIMRKFALIQYLDMPYDWIHCCQKLCGLQPTPILNNKELGQIVLANQSFHDLIWCNMGFNLKILAASHQTCANSRESNKLAHLYSLIRGFTVSWGI